MISYGLMDMYSSNNGRVGDMRACHRAVDKFQHLAQHAKNPEDRERYAQAAVEMKNELLPKMRQEMEQLGRQIGLDGNQLGRTISIEDLLGKNLGLKQDEKGKILFFKEYS